ncbi:MAG: sporulation protein [Cytophagaceae bacterium]|jgi:sporulation-control protein spo0M|nr:sporulation protein [Cytophagaceae bacterium]
MGFLDTLKSMVGSGAPTVEVKLQKTQASVMESVKGTITVTGGEYDTSIERFNLYVLSKEVHPEKKKESESEDKVGSISFNEYLLAKKEVIQLPFQVIIPKDNLLSSAAITNYIKVSIDIPGKDVFGVSEIKIQ